MAFYRGIVSPEQSSAGVRVYELQLRPGSEADLYQYDLVLIQAMRHDNSGCRAWQTHIQSVCRMGSHAITD